MAKIKSKISKMNLTLQVTKEFTAALDKVVARVSPRVSRSSAIQAAILEWMERQKAGANND